MQKTRNKSIFESLIFFSDTLSIFGAAVDLTLIFQTKTKLSKTDFQRTNRSCDSVITISVLRNNQWSGFAQLRRTQQKLVLSTADQLSYFSELIETCEEISNLPALRALDKMASPFLDSP